MCRQELLTTWGSWVSVTCPMAWFCRSHPVYATSRESPFSTAWPSPRFRSWTTTASNTAALFAFAKHTWGSSRERNQHLIIYTAYDESALSRTFHLFAEVPWSLLRFEHHRPVLPLIIVKSAVIVWLYLQDGKNHAVRKTEGSSSLLHVLHSERILNTRRFYCIFCYLVLERIYNIILFIHLHIPAPNSFCFLLVVMHTGSSWFISSTKVCSVTGEPSLLIVF